MKGNRTLQFALRILSALTIFGGVVRLFAGRNTFESFAIGELWTSQPYFIYIYRVLGAFVIFLGIVLFVLANEPYRYRSVIRTFGLCFAFAACVMLLSGLFLKMAFLHYAFDLAFCMVVAVVCFAIQKCGADDIADNERSYPKVENK